MNVERTEHTHTGPGEVVAAEPGDNCCSSSNHMKATVVASEVGSGEALQQRTDHGSS
jgi:hypothetical protein